MRVVLCVIRRAGQTAVLARGGVSRDDGDGVVPYALKLASFRTGRDVVARAAHRGRAGREGGREGPRGASGGAAGGGGTGTSGRRGGGTAGAVAVRGVHPPERRRGHRARHRERALQLRRPRGLVAPGAAIHLSLRRRGCCRRGLRSNLGRLCADTVLTEFSHCEAHIRRRARQRDE